jgi:hypothetical protein
MVERLGEGNEVVSEERGEDEVLGQELAILYTLHDSPN